MMRDLGTSNAKPYIPELGQLAWGQPSQPLECPEYVEVALRFLEYYMDDKYRWKPLTGTDGNPFRNTGGKFCNSVFCAEAYSWNEEVEQPYNFKWHDLEISWYKYLGRGMSVNRAVSSNEAFEMLKECVESLKPD